MAGPTLNLLPTWWAAVAGYALCWSIIADEDNTLCSPENRGVNGLW
ncbi:hypothetical protein AWU68_0747 [Corynebacterium simulans]|nr:hypothetical protein [Corynebacterium simulans]AMO91040.1 hypothetical protein AWU68_0747 [Corynebacterium simulans]